ncbi:MAG: polysaccharide biosynthesis tyrosine autokinase [Muribaculaceae bacterium]|nr:polysaccharide biosynthesis tyrosine autokinase [Muribaculaceae bacterium]
MAEVNDSTKKDKGAAAQSGSVPIIDIIFQTLHHWPWIVLSIVICVGAAYVHLLRTPNVYTRSAEIMIKDDQKGQSAGAEFANLGLFQSNTNIQNEITNLKAKDLMEEVVKRLGLDINYYHSGRFHDVVAYGYDLPVKVALKGFPNDQSLQMELDVDGDGAVKISKLKEPGKEEIAESFTGKLNDSIQTPVGEIVVTPSNNYEKGRSVSLLIKKIPLSAARDSYNARLGVAITNANGSVIRLTMADQSTQRADEVLNTLIGVYNEYWIRDKNQIAVSTSNFINDRLGVIESELGHVDSDISSYKSANLVPDVQAAASMYMSESQQTQSQILSVNNQLSMARYIRSYLTAEGNKDQLLPANTGLQSSNVSALIGVYNDKLLQRNSLVAKSSEKNPLVVQLDTQLDAQRQAIVRTIDNEIVALNTQLKSLRASEAQTISRIASNPTQAKNLLSTERQQKVKESLYLFLLQKREENELSQAFTAYNTRIVNKPGASGVPPSPNRSSILSVAFLIGLAIPFGFFFVREITNTKVRGRKDVDHLAVPFLGEIPLYKPESKDEGDESSIVVKSGKRNIINEAFRVLRTNVEFMSKSTEGSSVIALTSFNPGSGKSFISINLATSIVLKGKRVLVIDGDMRHGSTSASVGSPDSGLADYLCGDVADVDSLIVKSADGSAPSVLPVGSIPPNPTELLESQRFAQLISQLKADYDFIIIDCPPIEVVADAQIIDQYVDRTFFVVRAGILERSMVPELDRLYDAKKYRNMAFVLNGTRNEQSRYGYSHSYRYGYGYGYGYGYNYGNAAKNKKK